MAFPKSQKAKLVVRFVPYGKVSPDLRILYAVDKCKQQIPCQSRVSTFEEVQLSLEKPVMKVVDLFGQKDHPDRVTVLAVNRSLEASVPGSSVERWLLVPPSNVQFERVEPSSRRWRVKWDRVGLKDHAPVWGQYEVLRRRVGQKDSDLVPLNRTEDEFYGGDVPTDDDYVFTVKVVDLYGNKSHPAKVGDRDTFAGDWFGVVSEQHGLYLSESMVQLRDIYDEKTALARKKIQRMPESTEHERQRKREELESQQFVEELGDLAMDFASELAPTIGFVARNMGFPVKFSIRRRAGEYFLTVKSILYMALNEDEFGDLPLESAGDRSLRLKSREVPLLSKMVFHSPREDFIHTDDGVVVTHRNLETNMDYDFVFSWWFYRSESP
jgi:hypothetical protein